MPVSPVVKISKINVYTLRDLCRLISVAAQSATQQTNKTNMKSTWNDGIGSRERSPVACLVTEAGQPHKFAGASIPGICQSTKTGSEKKGKWSNCDYAVLHHDSTIFVSWRQDWDTGESWPQSSWDEGYRWLATKAPSLSMVHFESFIRANWPKAAAKWDLVAEGEAEFGKPSTAEQLAAIEAGKSEIARLNAEAQADKDAAKELSAVTEAVRWARENRDRAAARLVEIKAEAESVDGLTSEALNAETAAIWSEVRQMEEQLSSARSKVAADKKKKELGNSLGNAFAALGI